jgi:hypothetical protein
VGAKALITLEGLLCNGHPQRPIRVLASDRFLRSVVKRTRRAFEVGSATVAVGVGAINLFESRQPGVHITATFLPFPSLTVDDRRVEEARGQFGEAAMGTNGTGEGIQGLTEAARATAKAREVAVERAIQGTVMGASDVAKRATVGRLYHFFTFSLPGFVFERWMFR